MARSALVLASTWMLLSCANVRLVQRNDCWVRQTESFPKRITEEIGPCMRAEPKWSEDRVARLVQECMAEADHRRHNQALAAWSRGQPMPLEPSDRASQSACMNEAAALLATENEALNKRLAQLTQERDALAGMTLQEREHLRSSQDRMTDALGEAAKKPAPSAYATSNSTGTATTESQQTAQPGAPVLVVPAPSQERPACKPQAGKGGTSCPPAPKSGPALELH